MAGVWMYPPDFFASKVEDFGDSLSFFWLLPVGRESRVLRSAFHIRNVVPSTAPVILFRSCNIHLLLARVCRRRRCGIVEELVPQCVHSLLLLFWVHFLTALRRAKTGSLECFDVGSEKLPLSTSFLRLLALGLLYQFVVDIVVG